MSFHERPARRAVGVILPSSNRIVERVAHRMIRGRDDIDICFARVPYGGHPEGGYDPQPFLMAASMLAEARVDRICWNATRGALLGFDPDRRLCERLQAVTEVPVTSSALETLVAIRRRGVSRVAMIAQGNADEADRIAENFKREGVGIVATHALSITSNFEAAMLDPGCLATCINDMARLSDVDAVLVWSTNLDGHALVPRTKARPILLDSAMIGMEHLLGL